MKPAPWRAPARAGHAAQPGSACTRPPGPSTTKQKGKGGGEGPHPRQLCSLEYFWIGNAEADGGSNQNCSCLPPGSASHPQTHAGACDADRTGDQGHGTPRDPCGPGLNCPEVQLGMCQRRSHSARVLDSHTCPWPPAWTALVQNTPAITAQSSAASAAAQGLLQRADCPVPSQGPTSQNTRNSDTLMSRPGGNTHSTQALWWAGAQGP